MTKKFESVLSEEVVNEVVSPFSMVKLTRMDMIEVFLMIEQLVLAKLHEKAPFAWADDGSLRSGSADTSGFRVVTSLSKDGMPKSLSASFSTPLYTTPMPTPAIPSRHPDDIAVDSFAAAMKTKLAKKREEGRGGWQDKEQCSAEWLSELLRGHIGKGDPVDVANFCMMLHQRGESITLGNVATTTPAQEPSDVSNLARIGLEQRGEPSDSPTKGMNLGQRIAHVGGRNNAQGYIEFGSPMAVDALIQHVLRDMATTGQDGAFQARYRLTPDGVWSTWGHVTCGVKGHDMELRYLPDSRQPAAPVQGPSDEAVNILRLALEYWSDRQQRYKNRSPIWVTEARALLARYGSKS